MKIRTENNIENRMDHKRVGKGQIDIAQNIYHKMDMILSNFVLFRAMITCQTAVIILEE